MNNGVSTPSAAQDPPLLRRRNSIATDGAVVPTKLSLLSHQSSASSTSISTSSATTATTTSSSSTSSFTADDLDLLTMKSTSHTYTSIKDLLPGLTVNSPRPSSAQQAQSGPDICIRNRLVKQAAWAYLQPMSTSPDSAGSGFLHRLWPRVTALIDFVERTLTRVVSWVLRIIRIRHTG